MSLPASVLAALPAPPSASMTVGGQGPGLDGDAVFYAYTSPDDPGIEQDAYDAALRAAGFEPVERSGAWTAYRRDGATVWVSVSSDGPPTSIVALVATNPAAMGLPARLRSDPSSSGPLALVPPATPEPPSRTAASSPGSGGQGSSRGGGPTGAPGLTPSPAPSPSPTASPASDASGTPRASQKPRPTHAVRPSPKPKPTPKPKPSQAAPQGGTRP